MKKTAWIALLLIVAMAITGCGTSKTYAGLKIEKYVTLGEYKGLKYTPADTSVSDYALEVAVQQDMADNGYEVINTVELTEGTVQVGDVCNIDFKGLKDGVAFEGGTSQGYSLEIGSGSFIEGFEEGLVGVAIGSTVNLDLTFPENYSSEDLAGQDVVFEVKVNSVTKRKSYPEMTAEIANKLDENAMTADEYYSNKKSTLEAENIAAAEESLKDTLWNVAISNMTIAEELPKSLVEDAVEEFTAYYEMYATQSAYDSLEEWLTANNMTMTYFDQLAENYATSVVTSQLAAYAIANAEGYTLTDELYQQKAKEYATASGYTDVSQYIAAVGEDPIKDQAIMDYAVDLVVSNAVEQ